MADDDFADGTHIAEGNASWRFMVGMQNPTISDLSQSLCFPCRGLGKLGLDATDKEAACCIERGTLLKQEDTVRMKVQLFGLALLKAWEMMKDFDKAGFLPAISILQYPAVMSGWRWLAVPG